MAARKGALCVKRIETVKDLKEAHPQHMSIGFVPTMGFLHEGHASLIQRARAENDTVIVSIFVNPLQFAPHEDFDRYPRDIERDLEICASLGVDQVFTPTVTEMYGTEPVLTTVHVRELGDHLCGASRKGHFDGVCTVVSKLFHLVQPTRAYFGKKDAQQWRILKRMVTDLSMPVEIVPCEIVREADGLARSSRNVYLTAEERARAPLFNKTLRELHKALSPGKPVADHLEKGRAKLEQSGFRIDYLNVYDNEKLTPLICAPTQGECLIAGAIYIGKTRLIDNLEWHISS
ncbi:hypothetical protein ATW55_08520 [Ferroacidibacillus organovorans]|uniref:Pantothenate synthetase n=1 Tax=Ferroacidibacillus organovorans TaxID=1765683 RepID=A0A101XSQ3_9BACL|nr:hypothetical protein ATW55_08520 [Ferroacidibacillus organovorans]